MHGKQLQHSIKYIHTYKYVKLYVYLYVVGKLADTHAHTEKLTHAHRRHTWYANFERFVYENLCATVPTMRLVQLEMGISKICPPSVVPLFPFPLLTTNRLCQICAAVVFFTFWRFVRFFTYFFFFIFQTFVFSLRGD